MFESEKTILVGNDSIQGFDINGGKVSIRASEAKIIENAESG